MLNHFYLHPVCVTSSRTLNNGVAFLSKLKCRCNVWDFWTPPSPSECIAALNSPQCLAVSQFQCCVFTSRSNATSRGLFPAAYWWDRKRLTQRGDRHKLSDVGPYRVKDPFLDASAASCSLSASGRLTILLSQFSGSDLLGDGEDGHILRNWCLYLCFPPKLHFWIGNTELNPICALKVRPLHEPNNSAMCCSGTRCSCEAEITETFL